MNAETLAALKASIAKWEKNVRVRKADNVKAGVFECHLCELFNSLETPFGEECVGCPVGAHTGSKFCSGTPYDAALYALRNWDQCDSENIPASRNAFRAAAQAEVDFLRSLLPEGER